MESATINGIIEVYILAAVVFIVSVFLMVTIAWIAFFIKRRRRRQKADARIVAQAKGAGVWDKKPIVLGGRALELKAWEDFKIKREPGEPDAHLRRRCMAAADNEPVVITFTSRDHIWQDRNRRKEEQGRERK